MAKQSDGNAHPASGIPPIVAIGASAGGLAAYEEFFKAAPSRMGMAFVLIPHLDPRRHSLMVDLVSKYTAMPVAQATDGVAVQADHVYIIPPDRYLSIADGVLRLHEPKEPRGLRMAIDFSFRSLAESARERAVAVILSGTGTDGTQGLKAVKGNGGMAMVQEPGSAQHDGMPRSAIRSGVVDFVLPPAGMPEVLRQYVQHQYVRATDTALPDTGSREQDIEAVLSVVRARTRHDFRRYKRGTVLRRVQRRMGLRQMHRMGDYLTLLRRDSTEVSQLFDDLLIGVTQFFREPEYFEALEQQVIERLLAKPDDQPIRVWVPGCATGEEAYSIAIAIMEGASRVGRPLNLQIFATDVDERALAVGRTAIYPESIAGDISEDRLRRYFTGEDHSYRVSKHVRECVVFARQDLINDPPFSRLDLVSCRNLLIYLEGDLQHRILSLFSFALNDEGFLFLGSSETIGRAEKLFRPLDKRARIFQRVQGASLFERQSFPARTITPSEPLELEMEPADSPLGTELLGPYVQGVLLERFVPASVVVTEHHEIVQLFGATGDYLQLPNGPPSNDLLQLSRRGLRMKLRQIIRQAGVDHGTVSTIARVPGGPVPQVRISASPLDHPRVSETLYLVSFQPASVSVDADDDRRELSLGGEDEGVVAQLEHELKSTREELQGTIEELETSNEELKTSHEEAMSMNEELQSANEELETSKEELQSLNEELSTVNTELQEKLDELEKTNNDLGNLLESTDFATLFLDTDGLIRRFTPSARRLFNLIPTDIGRPIDDIANRIRGGDSLLDDVRAISRGARPVEDEVQDVDNAWYIRRIVPYRNANKTVTGVVVTYAEVTALKSAQARLRASEARYRALYDHNPTMFFTLAEDLSILSVNRYGAEQLGATPEALQGQPFAELNTDSGRTERLLRKAFESGEEEQRWDARLSGAGGELLWARCTARVVTVDEQSTLFVLCQDLTAEKRLSDQLEFHATHDALTGLLNRREFDAVLRRILRSPRGPHTRHTVLRVDISNFKLINDTAGTEVGDSVLRQFGGLLRELTRGRDIVARLGGDEFGIIMEYCPAAEARRITDTIRSALGAQRFEVDQHQFRLEGYFALVGVDDQSLTPAEIMRRVDVAGYAARMDGPGSVSEFSEADKGSQRRRTEMQWGGEIRDAIGQGRIQLACQPIVSAASDRIAGFELLLRLRGNDGAIHPDTQALISAAEVYGMAPEVDLHVTELALQQMEAQLPRLSGLEFIAINVSGQSLGRSGFAERILELIAQSRVPASKLCFEITETATISNLDRAIEFVRQLRSRGCRVAIDDFGSGLASFHYLKSLPCDLVKIDGAFVRDMLIDRSSRDLVAAIDGIAKLLGVRTVAEFVETDQIDQEVCRLGIDYRQGRHFPLAADLDSALDHLETSADGRQTDK